MVGEIWSSLKAVSTVPQTMDRIANMESMVLYSGCFICIATSTIAHSALTLFHIFALPKYLYAPVCKLLYIRGRMTFLFSSPKGNTISTQKTGFTGDCLCLVLVLNLVCHVF